MKFFTSIALIAVFLFSSLFTTFVYSQDSTQAATPSAVVDSYTLFWPLAAGKTEADSFYFLKVFKENLRGLFKFGDNQKADYAVLLATKRILEVEELLKEGKTDYAKKSLQEADRQYTQAYESIKKAANDKKFSAAEIRRDRLINAKNLLESLKASSSEDMQVKLEETKEKNNALLRDYLP